MADLTGSEILGRSLKNEGTLGGLSRDRGCDVSLFGQAAEHVSVPAIEVLLRIPEWAQS